MLRNNLRCPLKKFNAPKYHLTVCWMLAHRNPLFVAEFRRFSKNRIRDTDFADIVQHRAKLQSTHLTGRKIEFAAETQTKRHYTPGMAMCFKVASFKSGSKGFESRPISILKRIECLIQLCRSLLYQFLKMIFVSLL